MSQRTEHHLAPRLIVAPARAALARELGRAGVSIGRPVLVLIGGATKMDGDGGPDLAPTIRDGIIATARALDATVIDGGTDAGVMALAGQARSEVGAGLTLIGVAPLGKVHIDGVTNATGRTEIEPHHTHVLLIDGADWGSEVPWLIDVAHAIADGQRIVAVAVDGGQVAGIEANKAQVEGWPLVTVAGSGRTADDLARIHGRGVHVVELAAGPAALAATIEELFKDPARPAASQAVEYPPLYEAISDASRRGQRRYRWLTAVGLTLTLVGIGLGIVSGLTVPSTAAPTDLPNVAFAVATVGCFLLALILRLAGAPAGFDDDWRTGRSVAEGVKSQAWRYVMHVPPYADSDADLRLAQMLEALLRRAMDVRQAVDRLSPSKTQITDWMHRARAQSTSERRSTYLSARLEDQRAWYARKSADHRRASSRLFWLTVVAQVAAVISAVLALGFLGSGDTGSLLLKFMSLFGAIAIAFTSWTQMNRHSELSSAYAFVFQELGLIADALRRAKLDVDVAQAVASSEDTISRENRAWVAKSVELLEPTESTSLDS